MASSSVDRRRRSPASSRSCVPGARCLRAPSRHPASSARRRAGRACGASPSAPPDCASTQSRIICCSVRMLLDEPWMPSARLAMAAATRWLEPPSPGACAAARTARASRRAGGGARHRRRRDVGADIGDRRQPVFQLGVEAVLRPAGLEVEEAEDQRAGKAEQRGRERRAHAAQRRRQAGPSACRARGRRRCRHRAPWMVLADRADRAEQAPERAEQAEEDQQAGEVARDVARSRRGAWRSNRASSAARMRKMTMVQK
jgi:hypothetical protein